MNQGTDLSHLIKDHHASLFGELHTDPNLKKKYLHIITAAASAGIKDVVIEQPLSQQSIIDSVWTAHHNNNTCQQEPTTFLLSQLLDPTINHINMAIATAAVFNLRVHAVDTQPDRNLLVMSAFHDDMVAYKKASPQAPADGYFKDISIERLLYINKITGKTYTRRTIQDLFKQVTAEVGDIHGAFLHRFSNDAITANFIRDTTRGRPFIGLFGMSHLLEPFSCREKDIKVIDSHLRAYFGDKNVLRVLISEPAASLYRHDPHYVLSDNLDLRPYNRGLTARNVIEKICRHIL